MRWSKKIGAIGVLSGASISIFLLFLLLLMGGMALTPSDMLFVDVALVSYLIAFILHVLGALAIKKISRKPLSSVFLITIGVSDCFVALVTEASIGIFLLIIPIVTLIWAGILGLVKNPRLKISPEILPSMLGILGGMLGISILFWASLSFLQNSGSFLENPGENPFYPNMFLPFFLTFLLNRWMFYSIIALIGGILLGKKKLKVGGIIVFLVGILGFFNLSSSLAQGRIIIDWFWMLPSLPLFFSAALVGDYYRNSHKTKREI
jgi:hypothetical protein